MSLVARPDLERDNHVLKLPIATQFSCFAGHCGFPLVGWFEKYDCKSAASTDVFSLGTSPALMTVHKLKEPKMSRVAKFTNLSAIKESSDLSRREKECILWTAKGKSSWEIGVILGISKNTVDFHLKNVRRKLDATSRTVAAIKAVHRGIIEL
ncbi:helix-turn-helix transcriptional regulator [Mesorhizobium sp. M0189]|uniref:helix-turn-helix domain-containing protein n=1 Tax=Mesorhizobium sp. M0189 TaxID=2956909 RepID=UPI003335B477